MEKELLIKGLLSLGIEPSETIGNSFLSYLRELKKWNKAYNLTALTKDEDIIIKHFIDSLLYLNAIPEVNPSLSVCDIGSGAGFPGVPLAIVRPDLNISAIEPSRKKCAFLRNLKRTLSLSNVEVLESRVEDIRDRYFDIALTRALCSIGDLIKKAGHVLKKDGIFILSKGPKLEDEMENLGVGVTCEVLTVNLPLTDQQRHIVSVRGRC